MLTIDGWRPGIDCFHCGASVGRADCHQIYCAECSHAVNELREVAAGLLRKEIYKGSISPISELACIDCGDAAEHYDHRDYANPTIVDAVCRKCNYKRGPAVISGFTKRNVPEGWRKSSELIRYEQGAGVNFDYMHACSTVDGAVKLLGLRSHRMLALKLGVTRQAVSLWKRTGKIPDYRVEEIKALAVEDKRAA